MAFAAAVEAAEAAARAALEARRAEEEEAARVAARDAAREAALEAARAALAALEARDAACLMLAFTLRVLAAERARERDLDRERRLLAILYNLQRKKTFWNSYFLNIENLVGPNGAGGRPPHVVALFDFENGPKYAGTRQWNVAPKFV